MSIIAKIKHLWALTNSKRYVKYLRTQGVSVGGVIFRSPITTRVDITRPSLVTIGDNVDINNNFQLLTHDFTNFVFRNKYCEFVNSSGAVNIGSNIYIGTNVIVLKGVSIGDNCIVAAGSVVTKSIPANSVAAGVPCRVVATLDEYFEKRKQRSLEEAKEYVNSIFTKYDRPPKLSELYEEFIWFVDGANYGEYSDQIPMDRQLQGAKEHFLNAHKARFQSFDAFIDYCRKLE